MNIVLATISANKYKDLKIQQKSQPIFIFIYLLCRLRKNTHETHMIDTITTEPPTGGELSKAKQE
ncbi:MAG: hypothetical protein LLG13_16980 [Bacteroidales bacterium]|nr:hypothetical protein [Bacteroidales bacterium]